MKFLSSHLSTYFPFGNFYTLLKVASKFCPPRMANMTAEIGKGTTIPSLSKHWKLNPQLEGVEF
jgi:hypothetical protein